MQGLRQDVERLSDDELRVATEIWLRDLADVELTRSSAAQRGQNMLLVVGALTALVALATPAISGSGLPTAMVLAGILVLLFFALGTARLGLRAQEVTNWTRVRISPQSATPLHNLQVEYAVDLLISVDDNRERNRAVVGYLLDAQKYAFITVVLVALLGLASVFSTAQASRPPTVESPAVPPSPTALAAPKSPSQQ